MFRFRHFVVCQDRCAMKVGTDGVLLGAWAHGGTHILDVGTGTGLIALMMAQRFSDACITALDIDEAAACQAQDNVDESPFSGRIVVLLQRVQEHEGCYDSIVCNPPFFIRSLHSPDSQRNLARHAEGLSYADLMDSAWRLLAADGELSVIVPFDYRQRLEDEAVYRGFFPSRICAVSTKPGAPCRRYLLAFRKQPCHFKKESLVIGDDYYKMMTGDFYL